MSGDDPRSRPDPEARRSYSGHYMANGKKGEAATLSLLTWLYPPDSWLITDVSDDPEYFSLDIDFEVTHLRIDDAIHHYEAKYDSHVYKGNFVFEYMRIYHDKPPESTIYTGWSVRTATHDICCWSQEARTAYVYSHTELIAGLQKYCVESPAKQIRMGAVPTDQNTTTFNIYIPHKYVRHEQYRHDKVFNQWSKL